MVVARAEDPAAVADSAPAAAVGGASGGGTPKAAAGSEDVDALAQRLFPPMLRRIKTEFCSTGSGAGYAPTRGEWVLSPERYPETSRQRRKRTER